MDETYVKVKGKWTYLYQAVHQHSHTVDFLLSAKRDQAAATRFLRQAIVSWGRSTKLTLDKYQANHLAIQALKETQYLTRRLQIRTAKCLTNRIERDHWRIKQRVRAMQTFQVFATPTSRSRISNWHINFGRRNGSAALRSQENVRLKIRG